MVKLDDSNYYLSENANGPQLEIQALIWDENVAEVVRAIDPETSISITINGEGSVITDDVLSLMMKKNCQQILILGAFFIDKDAFKGLVPGVGLNLSLFQGIFELRKSTKAGYLRISTEGLDNNLDNVIESLDKAVPFTIFVNNPNKEIIIDEIMMTPLVKKNWQKIEIVGSHTVVTEDAIWFLNIHAKFAKITINDKHLALVRGDSKRPYSYLKYGCDKSFQDNVILAAAKNDSLDCFVLLKMPSQQTLATLANDHKFHSLFLPEKYAKEYEGVLSHYSHINVESSGENSIRISRSSYSNTQVPTLDVSGIFNKDTLDLLQKSCGHQLVGKICFPDENGILKLSSWDETIKDQLRRMLGSEQPTKLKQLIVLVNDSLVDDFVLFAQEIKLESGCIVSTWGINTTRIYFGKIKESLIDLVRSFNPVTDGQNLSSNEFVSFINTDVNDEIIESLSRHPGLQRIDLSGSTGITIAGIEKIVANATINQLVLPKEFLEDDVLLTKIFSLASDNTKLSLTFAE